MSIRFLEVISASIHKFLREINHSFEASLVHEDVCCPLSKPSDRKK